MTLSDAVALVMAGAGAGSSIAAGWEIARWSGLFVAIAVVCTAVSILAGR
jgi:hypothetical protein